MYNKENIARRIIEEKLGEKVSLIQRFPTGLSHYVFDVSTVNSCSFVIRIARPERSQELESGIVWHKEIERVGVRLPKIYEFGRFDDHYYGIYERLKGDDLENIYSSLSVHEWKSLAEEVAEIQRKISSLDGALFEKISPWYGVLQKIIRRSEREILSYGLCNPAYVDLIRDEIEKHMDYIQSLKPAAFLYDLSVRNVIVNKGRVTGIIDVDEVWFGDPLLAIGRGKTILRAMQQDTEFTNHWCEYIQLSDQEMEMVELYSLLFCLRFMGSIGTKLNGNSSIQTNSENARLFERMADKLLKSMGKGAH